MHLSDQSDEDERASSPTDGLADGFEASSLPPIAGDGGLQLEPAPTDPLPEGPISICELGPCRHYHELFAELDAQKPLDGSKMRLPVIRHRSCYPIAGREIELSHGVKECNLWDPQTRSERELRDQRQQQFKTFNEERYAEFLKSWGGDDAQR